MNTNKTLIVFSFVSGLIASSAYGCDIANSEYQLLRNKQFNAQFVFSNMGGDLSEPLLHISSTKTK